MVLFIWARSILCLVRLFASAGAEGDGGTVTAFLWLFPHGASFIRSTARNVAFPYFPALCDHHQPFYDVAQFPDIARPFVEVQQFHGAIVDSGRLIVVLVETVYEGVDERRDVAFPLSEGRDAYGTMFIL